MTVPAASRSATSEGEVRFDWSEPEAWRPALEGIDGIYLVKPYDPERLDITTTISDFLDQAKTVRRVVLLSEIGAGERDASREERKLENLLERSSFEWTILRPHWFMQNFAEPDFYLHSLRDDGEIRVPTGDQAASFVDTRDIAEVAFCALLEPNHVREHYTLTGPTAYKWGQNKSSPKSYAKGERNENLRGIP